MRSLLSLCIVFVALATPAGVFAHAAPLESSPASSATIEKAPQEVRIRFSERLESGASVIRVRGPQGEKVSSAETAVSEDGYTLSTLLQDVGTGAYTVEWSVVSRDDGHFTRGAYAFGVGDVPVIQENASATEIVQITTLPEILGMTVELVGHGVLWAVFALFALVIRGSLRSRTLIEECFLVRGYRTLMFAGGLLAFTGAVFQIVFKAKDLAILHGTTLAEAMPVYVSTVAGGASVVRMCAALLAGVLALLFARAIVQSARITWQEWFLVLTLSVFAFFRAKVSHATANHFFPDFSVAVNFVHLIEKDIWVGVLFVLACMALFPHARPLFYEVMPRAFRILALNVGALAVTGSYIVWLHLKAPENLFGTQWGAVFLALLVVALALVGVRTAAILLARYRAALFSRLLIILLAAELVIATLVVYYSSAVIITSPPPEEIPTPVYVSHSENATIVLERYRYAEGIAVLRIQGAETTTAPALAVSQKSGLPVEVAVQELYPGTFTFPLSILEGEAKSVSITVPLRGQYDAVAHLEILKGAFSLETYVPGQRVWNSFAAAMALIAVLGTMFSAYLYRINVPIILPLSRFARRYQLLVFLATVVIAGHAAVSVVNILQLSVLRNPYRALCEDDGNMWHMMLPTKAGIPLSSVPREGCMWGMGSYQYLFPERAEYEYYRSLPPASASVTLGAMPVAGAPVEFTVNIRREDGSPPPLFVDMEKLVHVVIVSKDQSIFAHIHPDDFRPITKSERENATFRLSYTFPKAGEYLISVDYANGVWLESSQRVVHIEGEDAQNRQSAQYTSPAKIGPFDVKISYSQPIAGEVTTLVYDISRDGKPAELEPYLSAASHIAVVKNDLTAFVHTHGEVHPPGVTPAPVVVREGRIVHSMAAMATPPEFSYPIDAHVIFPSPGMYTAWGQFQSGDIVYVVPISIRVEE